MTTEPTTAPQPQATRPVSDYEPFKAPGVDCPECLVDTGDSAHFVGCPIGEPHGWATRAKP